MGERKENKDVWPYTTLFSLFNQPFVTEVFMNEEINKLQSDVHLYEDYINSIQYLEEFDEILPAKKLGTLTQNIIDNLKETQ